MRLLRASPVFGGAPAASLDALAALLEPRVFEDGERVVGENEPGDGLYFVVSGTLRVAKRLEGGQEKELAELRAGDCLGEMEALGAARRSASAYARGRAELLRLPGPALKAWTDAEPRAGAAVYFALAKMQSARLRNTSEELALLYDLSQLVLEQHPSAPALLARALDRVLAHIDGEWTGEARAHNPFEDELELAARRGPPLSDDAPHKAPSSAGETDWLDERTLRVTMRSPKRVQGTLLLRSACALSEAERGEFGRVLAAGARLLNSALENVEHRTDEALRERLRKRAPGV